MRVDWEAPITVYRAAAERFLRLVDSATKVSRLEFLASVGANLPDLYSAALGIPSVKAKTSDIPKGPRRLEELAPPFNSIKEKLGPLDGYWTMFDSTLNEAPVQGSLAGDICEIYSDVKRDIQHIEQWGITADVLWELRFGFTEHWGRHLTSTLKAIHDLRSNRVIDSAQ